MKRSGPLKRTKEPERRTPLRQIGKRGRRDRDELDAIDPELRERSDGQCEFLYFLDGDTLDRCPDKGTHVHHVWPRGAAPPDGIRNDLSNLMLLCAHHHDWIHNVHPEAARRMGYLR